LAVLGVPLKGTQLAKEAVENVGGLASGVNKVDNVRVKGLPSPGASSIVRNKFLRKEFEFAEEIVAHRGGNIVGPIKKKLPGIDGHLNGVPIQLKQLTGSSPTAVSQAALQAGRKAANAGVSGVEVFIRAPGVASEAILSGPIKNILNQQSSLSAINILTADGWVRIIR
jgi:hypothetical protein